jgi:hypothetical protein
VTATPGGHWSSDTVSISGLAPVAFPPSDDKTRGKRFRPLLNFPHFMLIEAPPRQQPFGLPVIL